MKLFLKILAAPIILLLGICVWILSGLLYCSAPLFGISSAVVTILATAVTVTGSIQNGIILFVIAFLISPVGLPMAATWVIEKMQRLRLTMKNRLRWT